MNEKYDLLNINNIFFEQLVHRIYPAELRLQNMQTCPCNEDPLTPHFYIVKLGFIGVYIIFLFLLLNIDCGYSLEPPH